LKSLLTVTAVGEGATGLALLVAPALLLSLLLGGSPDTPAVLVVARVTGAALVALGVACWLARNEQGNRAAIGLVAAMLLYNTVVAVVLIYACLRLGLSGIGLWPTVVLHAVLAVWCVANLRSKSQ
jgi:hypothetical protein